MDLEVSKRECTKKKKQQQTLIFVTLSIFSVSLSQSLISVNSAIIFSFISSIFGLILILFLTSWDETSLFSIFVLSNKLSKLPSFKAHKIVYFETNWLIILGYYYFIYYA